VETLRGNAEVFPRLRN